MIVRTWKAQASPERIAAYREHLQHSVFPVLKGLKGFIDANLLERESDEGIEIVVATRWSSIDAVKAFAGEALENAVVAPAAKAILISFDEEVAHWDVTAEYKP